MTICTLWKWSMPHSLRTALRKWLSSLSFTDSVSSHPPNQFAHLTVSTKIIFQAPDSPPFFSTPCPYLGTLLPLDWEASASYEAFCAFSTYFCWHRKYLGPLCLAACSLDSVWRNSHPLGAFWPKLLWERLFSASAPYPVAQMECTNCSQNKKSYLCFSEATWLTAIVWKTPSVFTLLCAFIFKYGIYSISFLPSGLEGGLRVVRCYLSSSGTCQLGMTVCVCGGGHFVLHIKISFPLWVYVDHWNIFGFGPRFCPAQWNSYGNPTLLNIMRKLNLFGCHQWKTEFGNLISYFVYSTLSIYNKAQADP